MNRHEIEINPSVFRAYDIRGVAGTDLDVPFARLVGQALGTYIRRLGGTRIAVGGDNRLSTEELKEASIEGAAAAGLEVTDIGMATSPILYFSVAHWGLDGGINVTGSHNPPEHNGFKLVHRGALPLSPSEIAGLRTLIERKDLEEGSGTRRSNDPKHEYFKRIEAMVGGPHRLRVVVDAGNGVAGAFAPELLRQLGCEVIELFCELDGRFPNRGLDPTYEENSRFLKAEVSRTCSDLGFGFDGDGDRLAVVDENGRMCPSEYIVMLLARDLLSRRPGETILFDIRCSEVVPLDIEAHGGVPYMYKSGHSLIKREMKEKGILFAGEGSGHMFFGEDYYGVDDALMAASKVLQIVSSGGKPMSTHFHGLPTFYPAPEIHIPCADTSKFEIADGLAEYFASRFDANRIDGVRINFGEGWALVRASNTNPELVLRFEGHSPEALARIKRIVRDGLTHYLAPEIVASYVSE